jgi:hypothetical protein
MATEDEMRAILETFAARFAQEPRLSQMTRDWDRTVELQPTDAPWVHRLHLRAGHLAVEAGEGAGGAADAESGAGEDGGAVRIVLRGSAEVLADLFAGRVSPTEPYLSGDLVVQASEADVMRLDVITLMIWGA